MVELHTGLYSDLLADGRHRRWPTASWTPCAPGRDAAACLGLEVHAGHGLTYDNVGPIAAIPELVELNIGHFLWARRSSAALAAAIEEMRRRMDLAPADARMILGIGTDLATSTGSRRRWPALATGSATGSSPSCEQRKAESRPRAIAATYAKRWAAKEACSKALGTGLRMGIALEGHGGDEPALRPAGDACHRLGGRTAGAMTPAGHEAVIHVTLTDDHPWAQAFVVIEARPLAPPGAARA